MAFLRNNLVRFILGMVMFSLFGGDLAADAMHDAFGPSKTQNAQHQSKNPQNCPTCTCAVHCGMVVLFKSSPSIKSIPGNDVSFVILTERAPLGAPVRIDHPPQLA